jgi:hypothetical protein
LCVEVPAFDAKLADAARSCSTAALLAASAAGEL